MFFFFIGDRDVVGAFGGGAERWCCFCRCWWC